jgi:hypothetical protein
MLKAKIPFATKIVQSLGIFDDDYILYADSEASVRVIAGLCGV